MKKTISIIMTLIVLISTVVPIGTFADETEAKNVLGAGGYFTVALMDDNTVQAWGMNSNGQLGLGDLISRKTPTIIPGLTGVKQIAVGESHSLALMADGTVKAWGKNDYGQLGLGYVTDVLTPTTIPGLTGVKQLKAGGFHSIALMNDGTVLSWGYNINGQLGIGSFTSKPYPSVVPGLVNVKGINAGGNFSLSIMADGSVKAWGRNDLGQLGLGNLTQKFSPTTVPGLTGVESIVTGWHHSIAIMSDKTIKVWGYNQHGQLGLGDTSNRTSPTINTELTNVKMLVAGFSHSLALMNDGTAKSWGFNAGGQLGQGDVLARSFPTTIPDLSGIESIFSGSYHSIALMNDGAVNIWGSNSNGQLGDGTINDKKSPFLLEISGILMPINVQAITEATSAVVTAEGSKIQSDVDGARVLVTALQNGVKKTELLIRLDVLQVFINTEAVKLAAITNATEKVVLAESTKTQASVDDARVLVNSLHDCSEKTLLLSRLNDINIGPIIVSQEYKTADTKINLAMSLPREPYLSLALLAIEKVTDPVEKAALVAEMQIAIEKSTASKPITVKTANLFVRLAEITGRDKYITLAESKTSQIIDEAEKQDAITRMDIAKLVKSPAEKRAYSALIAAEQWESINMITTATKLITALTDGPLKVTLTERINLLTQ